jgi:hypothetical protein
MYFARVPNRNSPPACLPREGYREDGKVTRIGDRHNLWSSRRHTPLFPIPKAIPVGHHLGRRHGRWGLLAPFEPVSACNPVLFLSWRWSNSCISRCDKHEYEAGPLLLEADPKRFLNERESESVQRITQVPPTEHGSHDGNFSMT